MDLRENPLSILLQLPDIVSINPYKFSNQKIMVEKICNDVNRLRKNLCRA